MWKCHISVVILPLVLSRMLLSSVFGGRVARFPPLLGRSCGGGSWCSSGVASAWNILGCCLIRASALLGPAPSLPLVLPSAFESRRASCVSPTPYMHSFTFLAPGGTAVASSSGGNARTGCRGLKQHLSCWLLHEWRMVDPLGANYFHSCKITSRSRLLSH